MAPIKKRTNIRAKIVAKSRPQAPAVSTAAISQQPDSPSVFDDDSAFSSFAGSKKDKRTMKHSAFVTKIEKANQKSNKRRRPSKKLQTQLEGLVDALPEIESAQNKNSGVASDDDDDWEGMSEDEEVPATATAVDAAGGKSNEKDMLSALAGMVNVRSSIKKSMGDGGDQGKKMEMKTLKSNRGRAKRKAKLEGSEMERFGKNLAEMSKPVAVAQGGAASGDRWAALRGFIGQTMERNPNFGKAA